MTEGANTGLHNGTEAAQVNPEGHPSVARDGPVSTLLLKETRFDDPVRDCIDDELDLRRVVGKAEQATGDDGIDPPDPATSGVSPVLILEQRRRVKSESVAVLIHWAISFSNASCCFPTLSMA